MPNPYDLVAAGDELQCQLAVDDGISSGNRTSCLRVQKCIPLCRGGADVAEVQFSESAECRTPDRIRKKLLAGAVFVNTMNFLVVEFVLASFPVNRVAEYRTVSALLNGCGCRNPSGIR